MKATEKNIGKTEKRKEDKKIRKRIQTDERICLYRWRKWI